MKILRPRLAVGLRLRTAWRLGLHWSLLAVLLPLVGTTDANASPTAIDLGTLGGTYSVAQAVNDSGRVVGYSAGVTGQPQAFSWTKTGGMVPVGDLGGGYGLAWDVNNTGQVVGWGLTAGGQIHAFSWTQSGGTTDLGTLGGDYSYTYDVSASGQVVGWSSDADGDNHAFSWTLSGGMVDLGSRSFANGVNGAGQVVGQTSTNSGTHAFSWTSAGGMVDLGTAGGAVSSALAVNDDGQVVGYSDTSGGEHHAMSWTESGGMVDLGTLGGQYSDAYDVNSGGAVVGTSSGSAFLWTQSGGMVNLGTLGGQVSSISGEGGGNKINDDGQIVGYSTTVDEYRHAFSWTQSGGMVDLGTLQGGTESAGNAVNATGQVVGWSLTSGGDQHATLWNTNASRPDPPTSVTATTGDHEATVAWHAPLNDGGSPITGYEITVSPGGQTLSVSPPPSPLEKAITGLDNCTAYTFTVRAINTAGMSDPSSPSNPVVPRSTTTVQVNDNTKVTTDLYNPKLIVVPADQCLQINWSFLATNKKKHTVTESSSSLQGLGPNGSPLFNSGLMGPGGSFTYFFNGATTYQYRSIASGDSTSPSQYGVVRFPVVVSPSSGTSATSFAVRWAPNPMPGFVFNVEYQFRAASASKWPAQWTSWKVNDAGASGTFVPNQGPGSYRFRARIKNQASGQQGGYSWWESSSLSCPCRVSVT